MLRPELLGLASLGCTMAVLGNAYVKHEQFYPSVVYITKSNPSMAIIYIQFLVIVILMGKIVRKIFFGQLRPAEFEHLMDRSWYAVTETCLAFTVFKDDLSPKFVALFVLLLFLKSFHWLSEDRVDFMERSPSISLLFHVRVLSLCIFLGTLDIIFIQHACHSAMTKGASVQLVFGFEYAIHLTIILNTLIKYILHTIDLNSDAPWENKAVYMLYLELFIGFIKVILYMFFFMIMMRIFTLPLFALRPMYLTMRAFKKALNDVVLSRRAIQLLNTSFPFATEEDLENSDNVCIICRETMTASTCKKLPCGHIFHRSCLRGWFLRQQTCPTCRMDIVRPGQNTAQPQQAGAGVQGAAANNFQQQVAALRQQLDALQQQRQQQQQQQLPNILNNLLQQQQANLGGQAPAMPQTPTSTAAAPGPASPTLNPGQTPEMGAGALPGAGSPSMAGRHPPFIPLPPFMMPVIPPPMPPPNFQGMSEEELREMEGSEREHVEARIRCLRNIQVLLDAAVTEMQQYSSVVARCNAQQTVVRASSVSNSSTPVSVSNNSTSSLTKVSSSTVTTVTSSGGVGPSTSSSSATEVSPSPSSSSTFARNLAAAFSNTGARPKVREQETVEETIIAEDSVDSSNSATEKHEPVTSVTAETSIISSPAAASQSANPFETLSQQDDQDEIRRRRLAVFEEKKKQLLRK